VGNWGVLSPQLRRSGVRILFSRFGVVVGSALGNLLATNNLAKIYVSEVGRQSTLVANLSTSVLVGTLLGAIAGALASWVLPRFFRSLHTT
jgi:NAD dependent epimerase/dehydratase family enzyme